MKRILAAIAAFILAGVPIISAPQISYTVNLTTGTPSRPVGRRTMANSLLIQMQPGTTNTAYVLYAPVGTTCNAATAGQVVAALGPGTATQPGSAFVFPSNGIATTTQGGVDVSAYCISGVSGDSVIFSFDLRQ